jgi:predicted GIY-YIG superfamily endonuclease
MMLKRVYSPNHKKKEIKSFAVYILELEDDCYYVGMSSNLEQRLYQHFNDNGSEWTKLHKPISTLKVIKTKTEDGAKYIEKQCTLEMMKIFGKQSVRGGPYTSSYHIDYWIEFKDVPIRYCSDIIA